VTQKGPCPGTVSVLSDTCLPSLPTTSTTGSYAPVEPSGDPRTIPALQHGTRSTYSNHLPMPGVLSGAGQLEPSQAQPGQATMIPRHELPGRIALVIGCLTSGLRVVGLVILMLS
jgi:hypothetical protein